MSNVTLFVDAAFDNFIYAAGGGIWVKTGGRTLSKNVLIDDVRDSCEAEFKVLNKGIEFASSHHWFSDTSRIIIACDNQCIVSTCNSVIAVHKNSGDKDDLSRVRYSKYQSCIADLKKLLDRGLLIEVRKVKSHVALAERDQRQHVNERVDILAKNALAFLRLKKRKQLASIITKSNSYGLILPPAQLNNIERKVSLYVMLMAGYGRPVRDAALGYNSTFNGHYRTTDSVKIVKNNIADGDNLCVLEERQIPARRVVCGYLLLSFLSYEIVKLPSPQSKAEFDLYRSLAFTLTGKNKIFKLADLGAWLELPEFIIMPSGYRGVRNIVIKAIAELLRWLGVEVLLTNSPQLNHKLDSFIESKGFKGHPVFISKRAGIKTCYDYSLKIRVKNATKRENQRIQKGIISILVGCGSVLHQTEELTFIRSGNGQYYLLCNDSNNPECFKVYCSYNRASAIAIKNLMQYRLDFNSKDKGHIAIKHSFISPELKKLKRG